MHRVGVIYAPLLAIMGVALWLAVYESGVHATIAGVVMGLLTPARPIQTELEAEQIVDLLESRDLRADDVRDRNADPGSVSACDRLIDALHPWTSYVIVPVFALANAGIVLSADAISDPSAVLTGVAVGTGRRQARRCHIVQLARRTARTRPPPRGRPLGTHRRRGIGRRDRVHGVAVHHRPGVRLAGAPGRRQDRHARSPRSSQRSPEPIVFVVTARRTTARGDRLVTGRR